MTAVTLGREELLALKSRLDLANPRHDGGSDTFDISPDDLRAVALLVEAAICKAADEGVSIFMPPDGDVTALGKEYLERRVSSMTESVDREQWRQEDGEAGRPEYWIGRLHEAKIALNNLTQGLERRGDSFGRALSTKPKP